MSIKYFVAMKRYLISGAMTLITGLLVISCHDTSDYMTSASIVNQKTTAYDEAFKEFYGDIDPNHTWGFKTLEDNYTSSTRSATPMFTRTMITRSDVDKANKNSNMWATQGWIIPDPLTSDQKDKVRRYFQQNQNPHGITVNYTDFFVQQVYKGGTKLDDSKTTEKYRYGNGDVVDGSANMDKLTVSANEYHIYDFNNGNRGEINVQNNNMDGEHYDAITLMEDCSTECFGFYSSRCSNQYNDQYVIIPGSVIDAWDKERSDVSVTGMFFVGFDFESAKSYYSQPTNTNMYLVTPTTADDPNGVTLDNTGNKYLIGGADGYYSDWIVRITKGVKRNNVSGDTGNQTYQTSQLGDTYKLTKWTLLEKGRVFCEDLGSTLNGKPIKEDLDFNDVVFDAIFWQKEVKYYQEKAVQETDDEGHLLWEQEQVYDVNSKQPLYYQADGTQGTNVTDRPVTQDTETPKYEKDSSGNIIFSPEEVSGQGYSEYKADIVLLAAGATLPLSVAGKEVHNAFGVSIDGMVNTVGSSSTAYGYYVDKNPVFLKDLNNGELLTISNTDVQKANGYLKAIPIQVQWNAISATTLGSGDISNNSETGAKTMSAPHKFKADFGTPWAQERFNIEMGLPKFGEWVGNSATDLTSEQNSLYLYEQNWTNLLAHSTEVEGYSYEDKEIIDPTTIGLEAPKIVTNKEVVLWTGTSNYSYSENVFRPTVAVGGHIRFYGEKRSGYKLYICCGDGWRTISNPEWNGNTADNNMSLWHNDAANGDYLDLKITEEIAATINSYGFKYQAWNLTLTSIKYIAP